MTNFVQLEIAEYERLKSLEEIVRHGTVFTEYHYSNGDISYSSFNAPEVIKDLTSRLENNKRDNDDLICRLERNMRELQFKVIALENRNLWQRIINKS